VTKQAGGLREQVGECCRDVHTYVSGGRKGTEGWRRLILFSETAKQGLPLGCWTGAPRMQATRYRQGAATIAGLGFSTIN
jgi:hypothetical protein